MYVCVREKGGEQGTTAALALAHVTELQKVLWWIVAESYEVRLDCNGGVGK